MNKFLIVKAANVRAYERALRRLAQHGLEMLTFHPNRIHLREERDALSFCASFELQDSAGFRKDYVHGTNDRLFAFDGLPFVSGIDANDNWAKQLDSAWVSDQAALEQVYGTWAFARVADHEVRVLSDFTGMTPVFYWHDADYLAVSNRQMLLAAVCGSRRLDVAGLAWLLGQANLIGDRTAWEGVRHLPPQWTLRFNRVPGDLSMHLDRREIWSSRIDPKIRDTEISAITQSLLEQCEALSRLPLPPLQIDITGGLDSRLSAALLCASPLRERIAFLQTRGPENGHEIQVGRTVAERLGIEHRALTPPPTHQTAEWILNTMRSSVFRYEAGLCPSDGLILPAKQSRIVVTGSAGEIYRRHCKPHMNVHLKSRGELVGLYRDYHQRTDPLDVELPQVRDAQVEAMRDLAIGYVDQGVELNDVTDVFFMRYRLPLWNGVLLNNIYGAVCVYPLVNYRAARYAFSKGYEVRVRNRIHFELLLALNPELCALPFLNYVWPREYRKRAKRKGVRLANAPFPVAGANDLLQASVGDQLQTMMAEGWELSRQYLFDHENSELWHIVDRVALERLFTRSPGSIKGVVQAKQIFALLGVQCALMGDYVANRDGRPDSGPELMDDAHRVFPQRAIGG